MSSSSAIPARTRRSGSELGLCRTLPNGRTLPSQLTKVPLRSVTGATGKTTSAARVTAEARTSSETTKPADSMA